MNRTIPILIVILMIAGAAFTYDTKHKAEQSADVVASLRTQVEQQKAALRLLKAEWSVLTQPARLQALVEKYKDQLGLQTADVNQFVTIDQVPMRGIDTGPSKETTAGIPDRDRERGGQ
jgi:hypothetical protein